jgi:hypothetical protein
MNSMMTLQLLRILTVKYRLDNWFLCSIVTFFVTISKRFSIKIRSIDLLNYTNTGKGKLNRADRNHPAKRALDRVSETVVGILLIISALFLAVAPVAAIWYSRLPFPGFMVEPTLLINSNSGSGWGPLTLGINGLERVLRIGEQVISSPGDLRQAFINLGLTGEVALQTLSQQGLERIYPLYRLIEFPNRDLITLFWLPYLIGVVYLLLGIWVFRLYGYSVSGRAFVYFCINAALVSGLYFDLSSVHYGSAAWTFALAQLGGAMVGMAVLIPEPLPGFPHKRLVRAVGYAISMLLAGWGLIALYLQSDPWAYVTPWRWSYIYGGLGIFLFLILTVLRLTRPITLIVREQIRIILAGSLMAFLPIGIWFIAQLFTPVRFQSFLFLPLILFPISIALAILRYHLWDVDLIIRRTLVYTLLTVSLVAIYLALIILLQLIFRNYIGDNTFFTVISTLVIIGLFSPLRRWIQTIVDRRFFRQKYDIETTMLEFQKQTSTQVGLMEISGILLQVVQDTLQPEFMSLWIKKPPRQAETLPDMNNRRNDV